MAIEAGTAARLMRELPADERERLIYRGVVAGKVIDIRHILRPYPPVKGAA